MLLGVRALRLHLLSQVVTRLLLQSGGRRPQLWELQRNSSLWYERPSPGVLLMLRLGAMRRLGAMPQLGAMPRLQRASPTWMGCSQI